MNTALFAKSRLFLGLAVAGAALLPASGASAQTPSPFFAFVASDLTASNGDPVYSVYDSVNFNSLQVNEVFADSTTQSFALPVIGAGDMVPTSLLTFTALPGGGYSDPVHGTLTSAILTGTMVFPGFAPTNTLSLTLQPTLDPNSQYQQLVYTPFSANLLGPASPGIAIGTFSLLNLGSNAGTTVNINATPLPAAVPEASTNISLGLLLALGLGSVAVARRKRSTTAAN